MIHAVDSLADERNWKADSLQLMQQLKLRWMLNIHCPSCEESAAYKCRWEGLQQEAERQLKQI